VRWTTTRCAVVGHDAHLGLPLPGGFLHLGGGLVLRVGQTPQRLLLYLIFSSGLLSALLVNDTVCLMVTPLVVTVIVRGRLPLTPYLLALAMSANIGSVATLVGNPQNMIIGTCRTSLPPLLGFAPASGARRSGDSVRGAAVRLPQGVRRSHNPNPVRRSTQPGPRLLGLTLAVLAVVFLGFVSGSILPGRPWPAAR